jgi:L-alanine-DL-glutamate epimerase-like enolase superfamily enzyme
MKITDVTLTLFRWDGIPEIRYGPNIVTKPGAGQLGLLRLDTDGGIVGHAFHGSVNRPADRDGPSLVQYLKPVLLGQNPLERERLNERLWGQARSTTVRAIGACDVALWDIAGKAANQPIHALLGSYRDSLPAYASSQALPSSEAYIEQALYFRARGVDAYKIHPPHPWREDIRVCEAVRKALGDDHVLMLDATWSYDYPTALKVGRAIEALGFYWYEDPLREQDIYNYVKLKQKLDVPILATELPFASFADYAIWITERATDFLRGDVAFKGGITTMIKTAHLAEAFAMNYEIHHGGNSLNNVANLHVATAIKNCEYFEVLLPDEANKYALVRDIEIDKDGLVHAPAGPGLGAEIDFELIERNKLAVLR